MPFQRTRQDYIDHQTGFRGRGRVVRDQIQQEWARKIAEQREEWINAYRKVQLAIQYVQDQRGRAEAAHAMVNNRQEEVDNIRAPSRDNFHRLMLALETAIFEWSTLRDWYNNLADAWRALQAVENGHPLTDQTSLDHCHDEAERAAGSSRVADGERRIFQELRDDPPVVANSAGQQRIPDSYLSQERRLRFRIIKNNEITEDHNVDFEHQGPGEWIAHGELSGGMSTGMIFLKYNNVDRIVDRVVRKHVFQEENAWFDARGWEDADIQKSPLEIGCHQALDTISKDHGELQNVVRLRPAAGNLVDRLGLSYRLYLEWAEYGDLGGLIKRHKNLPNDERAHIPEPFLCEHTKCS